MSFFTNNPILPEPNKDKQKYKDNGEIIQELNVLKLNIIDEMILNAQNSKKSDFEIASKRSTSKN